MLFNSPEYFVFLPLVAVVFFLLPVRVRWVWLLATSWYFYARWSERYLALFIGNTLVAYLAGIGLGRAASVRQKNLIATSAISILLGTLFVFKYLDFVCGTGAALLRLLGLSGKTVIIDEVHSADAYMLALVTRLLNWLGRLQVPVILLSATLHHRTARVLTEAYLKGAGRRRGADRRAQGSRQ